jgi:hypothetical protein
VHESNQKASILVTFVSVMTLAFSYFKSLKEPPLVGYQREDPFGRVSCFDFASYCLEKFSNNAKKVQSDGEPYW